MNRFSIFLRGGLLTALAPVTAMFLAFAGSDLRKVWLAPDDDEILMVLLIALLGGAVAAVMTLAYEQTSALRPYAIHRGVTRARLFWMRVAGSLVPLLVGMVLAIVISALARAGLDRDGAFVNLPRLVDWLLLASATATGYATGACLTTLRGRPLARILRAASLVFAVLATDLVLLQPPADAFATDPRVFAVMQVAMSVLLLAAARRGYLSPEDTDRPVPLREQRVIAGVGALALAACAAILVPFDQQGLARKIGYPAMGVGSGDAGELAAVAGREGFEVVDAAHARTRTIDPMFRTVFSYPSYAYDAAAPLAARSSAGRARVRGDLQLGPRRDLLVWSVFARAELLRPDGVIVVSRDGIPGEDGALARGSVTVLEPPNGPFSTRTELVGERGALGVTDPDVPCWVGDPASGRLWRLFARETPPRLEAQPLQDGDPYRGWTTLPWRSAEAQASARAATPPFAVLGARGAYVLDASGARRAPEFDALVPVSAGRVEIAGHFARVEQGQDPLHLRVTLRRAADDAIVLEHDYAPRTLRERTVTAGLVALALLRPPPSVLAGWLLAPPEDPALRASFAFAYLDEPLARGSFGPWLVLLDLVLMTWLAFSATAFLRVAGAERARVAFWCAIILLTGPLGAALLRLCEPRSAWARAPAGALDPAPAPRIVTA